MKTDRPVLASTLALTPRGQNWLHQFDEDDRGLARELLASLTLVSEIEFERSLIALIESRSRAYKGPVALYAVQELDKTSVADYFELASNSTSRSAKVDAAPRGADLGSEVRVGAAIRSLRKGAPTQYLNHPNVLALRKAKAPAIFLIDDFVASGNQAAVFLDAFWRHRTLRSWWSLDLIDFEVISYSASLMGERKLARHKARPRVTVERYCPTIARLPWPRQKRNDVLALCEKYGARTSRPRLWEGYGGIQALMVFEHGCPNNVPSMFWAPEAEGITWKPLFPDRAVLTGQRSAFPPQIARREPVVALVEMNQRRLAKSRANAHSRLLDDSSLVLLALIHKRVRDASAWCHATGLPARDCSRSVERLIDAGFVLPTMRVADQGRKELLSVASMHRSSRDLIPERGEDEYHPYSLRDHIAG